MSNKLKLVLHYGILCVFSLLVVVFITSITINHTLFEKSYYLSNMDNYYKDLNKEIEESIRINTMSAGFEDKIIKEFYDINDIKEDVSEYVSYIFNDSDKELDVSNVEDKIVLSVNNYLKENNIKDFDTGSINAYVNEVLDIYKEKITVMKIPNILRNRISKLHKIINVCNIILLIIIVVFIILSRKQILRFIFVPLYTTSILYIFTSIMLSIKLDIDNLLVLTYSISEFIKLILKNVINYTLLFGIILLIITLISQIITKKQELK